VVLTLVTGAASGLGLATAQALAANGHAVVVHARNASRIADRATLDRMHGAIYGDLAKLEETIALAEYANEYGRFDAVIHNAGVLSGPEVLAVNTVAPFVLTALMRKPRRLIYVSSSMHRSGSTALRGLTPKTGRASYEDSKLYTWTVSCGSASRSSRVSVLGFATMPPMRSSGENVAPAAGCAVATRLRKPHLPRIA
jgi:NAD(P)-dependent dehydrogenase (short-subunit alcohol dehydrogenase family)